MAMYPCDVDHRRYPGPQQTIYPALANGSTSTRRKLRLCSQHFDALLDVLEQRANRSQLEFDAVQLIRCFNCGQDVDTSEWMFFATAYAQREDRRDFWAPVHEACAAAVSEDWQLPV